MFDIGFSELLVIAVVALVVLGPERLPKAARFAGLWVRRARAQWYSVKSELERDLAAEELRKSLHDTEEAMRGFEDSVRRTGSDVEREFDAVRDQMTATDTPQTEAAPPEAPTPAPMSAETADDDAPSDPTERALRQAQDERDGIR